MHRTTPNWEEVSALLVYKLDEVADDIDWKIDNGEDPASAVDDALEELKLFIGAIETNPGQFTMKDVS